VRRGYSKCLLAIEDGGRDQPYARIPYFYSDQYDLGIEYTGRADRSDRVVFRGDPASREFVAFWLRNDRVVAAMKANVWDVAPPLYKLIESGTTASPARLADPQEPLEQLAPAA
jgi:3-phenylpropionate/trans-cinnamate dioxygenase ferredoxin reductase subunit